VIVNSAYKGPFGFGANGSTRAEADVETTIKEKLGFWPVIDGGLHLQTAPTGMLPQTSVNVTVEFEGTPVRVRGIVKVVPAGAVGLVGIMIPKLPEVIVTIAVADFVGSATEVAVIVTVEEVGATLGAV
jgi:hypothetical protein